MLRRFMEDFATSKLAIAGLVLLLVVCAIALLAPLIAPQNPYDLGKLDLLDSTMKARKFLRAPRCPVCGPGVRHGGVALEAVAEMPGNPLEG